MPYSLPDMPESEEIIGLDFASDIIDSFEELQAAVAETSNIWTPTWTNLTLGDGTITARWYRIGPLVFCNLNLTFGSTTSIPSGPVQLTPPVSSANGSYYGTAIHIESGANETRAGLCVISANVITIWRLNQTNVNYTTINTTTPWTWNSGDQFRLTLTYLAA